MVLNPNICYEQLLDLIDQLYQAKKPISIGHELFKGLKAFLPFDAAIFTPINWQTLELQTGYSFGEMSDEQALTKCSHAPFDSLLFDPLCLTRLNSSIRLSDTANAASNNDNTSITPSPFRHALGVVASWRQQPVAAIRLYRLESEPDFSDEEIKLLNRLALHVANAIYLHDTSLAIEPLRETGLIVFGSCDNVIYKNEAVNLMLEGIELDLVLSIVRKGKMWLRNGTELFRAELVPLTSNSLLSVLAKVEEQEPINLTNDEHTTAIINTQEITIISIEPFRRRQAMANRLKHSGLSQREIDVSLGIMRGLSNANIAKQLFIDEKTVKDHLQRIYAKVNIKTRTELISKMLGLDIELAQHENSTPQEPS